MPRQTKHLRLDELRRLRAVVDLVWMWKGWEPTRFQLWVADEIERTRLSNEKPLGSRLFLNLFREFSKTHLALAYILWDHYWDATRRTIIISSGSTFASDISTAVRGFTRSNPFFRHMAPSDGRTRVDGFDFGDSALDEVNPSVAAIGINGQVTGRRGDNILMDDVETDQNTFTNKLVETLRVRMLEPESVLRKKASSLLWINGTQHNENSAYSDVKDRGYRRIVIPICYPSQEYAEYLGNDLAEPIRNDLAADPSLHTGNGTDGTWGAVTDWKRFGATREAAEMAVRDLYVNLGRTRFLLNCMLDTRVSAEDLHPLKPNHLIVMDTEIDKAPQHVFYSGDPQHVIEELPCVGWERERFHRPLKVSDDPWLPYQMKVMAIDPSGTGSDETAYAIVGTLHGQYFLLACGGIPGGYGDEVLEKLATLACLYKVNVVYPEENFGQGMFTQLLKPHLRAASERYGHICGVEEDPKKRNWSSVRKNMRICDILQPVMNNHRLIVSRKVLEDDFNVRRPGLNEAQAKSFMLVRQMSLITRREGDELEHEDRLDALAMAVQYLIRAGEQDPVVLAERNRKELFQKRIAEIQSKVFRRDNSDEDTALQWTRFSLLNGRHDTKDQRHSSHVPSGEGDDRAYRGAFRGFDE